METPHHKKLYSRAREVFLQCIELPLESRREFLDRNCGNDDELQNAVEALVNAHADDTDQWDADRTASQTSELTNPLSFFEIESQQKVGRYFIFGAIGQGGMGAVYEAEQDRPRRRVALKVMRRDAFRSESALRRFEYESQVLARLHHPGIAQVYDAGTLKNAHDEIPYIAMELIGQSQTVTEYAESHDLPLAARLKLFVKICEAVQHGHTMGVIHRDLKPGNILVGAASPFPATDLGSTNHGATMQNGISPVIDPDSVQPKIIDFGVARVTDSDLASLTTQTSVGQIIGTIAYMSPEQCTGDPAQVDTRSDVYSLGVLFHELICGSLPYRLENRILPESLRVIREEPPTPLGTINRAFRGDLEIIVSKALEKEKSHRYQTANDLAGDIQRFLNDEPIVARPPSATYQIRKFAKRNKALIASAALLLVALLLGVAGLTYGLIQSNTSAQLAMRQKGYAEAISNFVTDDFLALTSVEGQRRLDELDWATLGKDASLVDLLDRAAEKLQQRNDLDPLIESQLRWIIGVSYSNLGKANQAIPLLQRSVAIRNEQLGEDDEHSLRALHSLAIATAASGDLITAQTLSHEAVNRSVSRLGTDHELTLAMKSLLADIYLKLSNAPRAIELLTQTLEARKAAHGLQNWDTINSMSCLGSAYLNAGDLDQAINHLKQAHELAMQMQDPFHPDFFVAANHLAGGYQVTGQLDQAIAILNGVLESKSQEFGEKHVGTLVTMSNLGEVYSIARKSRQAMELLKPAVDQLKELGKSHPLTIVAMRRLGRAYRDVGDFENALTTLGETLELSRVHLGENHGNTIATTHLLGLLHQQAGRPQDARPLLEKALRMREEKFGETHTSTLDSVTSLAVVYGQLGITDQAVAMLERAVEQWRSDLGPRHWKTLVGCNNLSMAYHAAGQTEEAIGLLSDTVPVMKEELDDDNPYLHSALHNLGMFYDSLRQCDKSIPLYEEALVLKTARHGRRNFSTLQSVGFLAAAYREVGRIDEAIELLKEIHDARKIDDRLKTWTTTLRRTYRQANRLEEFKSLLEQELDDARQHHAADSSELASTLASVGADLLDVGDFPRAESLLRECWTIRSQAHPDGWRTFNVQSMLGGALLGQAKLEEAEPLLVAGYQGLKEHRDSIPAASRVRLTQALDRLIEYATLTGSDEDLHTWQAEKEDLVSQ